MKEIPLATLVVLTGLKDIAGKYEVPLADFAEGGGASSFIN